MECKILTKGGWWRSAVSRHFQKCAAIPTSSYVVFRTFVRYSVNRFTLSTVHFGSFFVRINGWAGAGGRCGGRWSVVRTVCGTYAPLQITARAKTLACAT